MRGLHKKNKILFNNQKWKILEWWFPKDDLLIANALTGQRKWTNRSKIEDLAKKGVVKILL